MVIKDVYTKDKNGRLTYNMKCKVRVNGVVQVKERMKIPLTPEEYRTVCNYIDTPGSFLDEDNFTHLTDEQLTFILYAQIKDVTLDVFETGDKG